MLEAVDIQSYQRRVSAAESLFMRSPYSVVTLIARIKGNVTEAMLRRVVVKVQQRHTNLRVRIIEDSEGVAWFSSDNVEEISIESVARSSDAQWIEFVEQASQVPFEFDRRPAIRFILARSTEVSDLIIFCHHIICDGMSLAFLARDLLEHLGDPYLEMETLADPVPMDVGSIPDSVSVNRVARFFINRVNTKWADERVIFGQADYEALNEAYWATYKHRVVAAELTEEQTTELVDRCRSEGVTVNSALIAAFVGAQAILQRNEGFDPRIATAGSLRDRISPPAGEGMGFFAGVVQLEHRYKPELGFWENTRKIHKKVKPLINDKELFTDLLTWYYLDPTILHAIPFKMLGGLVPKSSPRHAELAEFHVRDDTILSLLKRDKMESLDRISIGTAVTNLARLDFPKSYGSLELDRMILKPGGAFPLTTVNFTLGVVTAAGKLSILAEFVEQNVKTEQMERVKNQALKLLEIEEYE